MLKIFGQKASAIAICHCDHCGQEIQKRARDQVDVVWVMIDEGVVRRGNKTYCSQSCCDKDK
jgi:phage terminase large subunit GpA-like protein